jgi:hypothetical protein
VSHAITFLVSGHLDQVRRAWAGRSWAPVGVLTSPAIGIDLEKVVALGCPWAADNAMCRLAPRKLTAHRVRG